MSGNSKYKINTSTGPLFSNMVKIALPLILTGILQLFYNATDMIVVGRFAGDTALSAVGSASYIVNLTVNCFIGLSIGSGIIVSNYFGAKNYEEIDDTIHTSMLVAVICGIFITILGISISAPMLTLMKTPTDVMSESVLYLKIFFIGTPFSLIYNFGASILRAIGDTKRPLNFLLVTGALNVILNLIFVVVFKMGVAGVATATVVSQFVAAVLILRCFITNNDILKLDIKKLKIHKKQLVKIAKIGFPAGIQATFFTISNTLVQSSINLFGSNAMAANAASKSIEGFLYTSVNGVQQAASIASGQNMGAKQYNRVRSCLRYSLSVAVLLGGVIVVLMHTFAVPLISLYTTDAEIIEIGINRLKFMANFYILSGLMDVTSGHIRGMGYSIGPAIITLCGVCIFRFFWIGLVFSKFHYLETIYIVYPITWTLTFIGNFIFYLFIIRKFPKTDEII